MAPVPAAVLLVMLPPLTACAATNMADLQQQIGNGVQVLLVDESTNPAVVRSFAPTQLPTCVLVHRGVELWRQSGLPNTAEILAALRARRQTLNL